MRKIIAAALWLLVATASSFLAPASADPTANLVAQAAKSAVPMTQGEIRKVDKNAGKLTIKHGPLTNLEMPAMTMVFRVKDPAMLDKVKEGDKVKFIASREKGEITVIQLEREN
jgi:Cu(I)/Ag(I) efflux system protein CusF